MILEILNWRLKNLTYMTKLEIIENIDRDFGFKPKAEELKHVKTLQDFYDYIEQHV